MDEGILAEMRRLDGARFDLLPLGGGKDGKSPLAKFKDKRIALPRVCAIMANKASSLYGIRLHKLAVADVDERSQELFDIVEEMCGRSPVQVDTPRGRHFFFANPDGVRHSFQGQPIDFKTGLNAYVAGPCSIRPDGGRYEPHTGVLGIATLPSVKSPPQTARTASGQVMEGRRNMHLVQMARKFAFNVDNAEELMINLLWERDRICEAGAHSVTDGEVQKIAQWAWGLKREGRLWGGERMLAVKDTTAQALISNPNGGVEALALFHVLQSKHNFPNRTFALSHRAMKEAGLIAFGRRQFIAGRDLLIDLGVLEKTANHSAGRHSTQYRLTKPRG